jgi:hypothetical protein
MALAAWRRGFAVELFVNDEGPPFLDRYALRTRRRWSLVHQEFLESPAHGHPGAPPALVGGRAQRALPPARFPWC